MASGEDLNGDELIAFETLADRPPVIRRHEVVAYDANGVRHRIIGDELNPLCAYSQRRQEDEFAIRLEDDETKRFYVRMLANNGRAVGVMVGHTRSPEETEVHLAYCHGCLHINLEDASRVAYPAEQAYNAWRYGFLAGANPGSPYDLLRIDVEYGPEQATYNVWTPLDYQARQHTTAIEQQARNLAAIIDFALRAELMDAMDSANPHTSCTTKPSVILRNDYWNLGTYDDTTVW